MILAADTHQAIQVHKFILVGQFIQHFQIEHSWRTSSKNNEKNKKHKAKRRARKLGKHFWLDEPSGRGGSRSQCLSSNYETYVLRAPLDPTIDGCCCCDCVLMDSFRFFLPSFLPFRLSHSQAAFEVAQKQQSKQIKYVRHTIVSGQS